MDEPTGDDETDDFADVQGRRLYKAELTLKEKEWCGENGVKFH